MASKKSEYDIKYAKEKLKRIPLDVPKEQYEVIKAYADYIGRSVNGLLKECIMDRIELWFSDAIDEDIDEYIYACIELGHPELARLSESDVQELMKNNNKPSQESVDAMKNLIVKFYAYDNMRFGASIDSVPPEAIAEFNP